MERTLSPDERVRRAEEIYQRRREQNNRTNQARVNVSASKDYSLLKKMFLQIAICLLIYFIFYLIKNSNYIFSEEFLKQTKEILSYDINLTEKYEELTSWLATLQTQGELPASEETEIVPPEEEGQVENETTEVQMENALPEENAQTLAVAEDSSSVSQTATDAEEIKSKYSLIKPLAGTITSRFGVRNPTTETVPKYHTGIDIAANTGTVFCAAMTGTVVQVSSEGDYRKSFKNTTRRCYYSICTLQ